METLHCVRKRLQTEPLLKLFTSFTLRKKVLILGIFRRGVMAGALALMMLNRLQMLKESRGQECKRPDTHRERKRTRRGKSKQETLLALEDPTGDMTNRRVTSVSFFQHKVIPLFPPLPPQHYDTCQSLSWQQHSSHPASFLLSIPYLLNLLFPLF